MAQVPSPLFAVGDRVCLRIDNPDPDEDCGVITSSVFNAIIQERQYFVAGPNFLFRESALRLDPPVPAVPSLPPPPPPFVAPPEPPILPEEIFQPPVSAPVGFLTSVQVQAMIDISLAAAITGLLAAIRATEDSAVRRAEVAVDPRIEALSNSIIRNVAQLSEIQSSLQEQEVTANETGDGGVSGFFRRVGGFIGAPFTSLLDVVETWLVREVTDGFNR